MKTNTFLKTLVSSIVILALAVTVVFAADLKDFTLLKGGSKPDTMKVSQTNAGIVVTGERIFDPTLGAAGIIYKNAVASKDVTVEYTLDKISTLNPIKGTPWSQKRDSWYTVSIMDKAEFWTTANDKVKSFTIAVSPISNNRAYVHAFWSCAGGFGQKNWLETITCKAGTKMNVNIKYVNNKIAATINGKKLNLDSLNNDILSQIEPIFGDKVYVAVACQTGEKTAGFTLKKINTTKFYK